MKPYKILSILFASLAAVLTCVMCAATAWNYCAMQFSILHQGYSAPASLALLPAIPYGLGILLCAGLAVVFHKKHRRSQQHPVTPLSEDEVRVIKISKDALFEFLYESVIDNQRLYFDADPLTVGSTFFMDWDTEQFIFCIHKDEDDEGKIIPLPEEIDLSQLLQAIPDTTASMYTNRRYRVYSREELMELSKQLPPRLSRQSEHFVR